MTNKYEIRRAVATALASAALGGLIGWNIHETSEVRANYIADLPTCTTEEK